MLGCFGDPKRRGFIPEATAPHSHSTRVCIDRIHCDNTFFDSHSTRVCTDRILSDTTFFSVWVEAVEVKSTRTVRNSIFTYKPGLRLVPTRVPYGENSG